MPNQDDPFGKAYEVEVDDGVAIFFLEGMKSRAEANSVANELATAFERQVNQNGLRHIACAVPPSLRLTMVRGNRIELKAMTDGRVRIVVHGRGNASPIIMPGR